MVRCGVHVAVRFPEGEQKRRARRGSVITLFFYELGSREGILSSLAEAG